MTKFVLLALPLLAAAQPQGGIEGIVFNKVTQAPMAGVRVLMRPHAENSRIYSAVSGHDGKYRIANLTPGVYAPSIEVPGRVIVPSPEFVRQRVQVSDKETAFDIPVGPQSSLSGRVLDPDKHPAAKVQVAALFVGGGPSAGTITDADGRFSVNLEPGRYHLHVRSSRWASTYYPSAFDLSSAEAISLSESSDLGGYEIHLRPLPKTGIRGVVRDPEGKPARGVSLDLTAPAGRISGDARIASRPDGAFEIAAVPPGRWLLTATAAVDDIRWMGVAAITMSDRDLDNVELRIHPPFALDAELEGLPRDRRTPLRVQLHSTVASTWPSAQEKEGRARIELIYPGAYRAGVFGFAPGYYLKSILLGPTDITGRIVELHPGSPPLRIVYAPNGGSVTGEVENGSGAKVFFLSADRDSYVPGADSFIYECDEQGRFAMRDLRPGNWYGIAFASLPTSLPNDTIRDRVFNRGLWRQAQSFRVGEGETATLKLKALTWLD